MLSSENDLNSSDHYESLPDQIVSSCQSSMDHLAVDKSEKNSLLNTKIQITTESTDPPKYCYSSTETISPLPGHKKSYRKRSPSRKAKYRVSSTPHSKTMSWISESSLETDLNRSRQVYSPISCCSSPYRSNYDISCTSLHYQETRDVLLNKNAFDKYGIKINRISDSFYISMIVTDSPAANAGLKVGDEIVRINDQTIEHLSNRHLLQLIKQSENELRISFKPRLVIARLRIAIVKKVDGKFGLRVQRRSEGIFVAIVIPNSAADLAGISPGDELLKVNEQLVSHMSQQSTTELLRDLNTDYCEALFFMRQVRPVEDFRMLAYAKHHLHEKSGFNSINENPSAVHPTSASPLPSAPQEPSYYHYQFDDNDDSTRLSPYNF